MIGCVPSDELRGEAQFVVTELVEPDPELERVPEPEQSVLLERCSDSLMDCPMPELSCVPYIGTVVPMPLPCVPGTCVPPPGSPTELGAT